jgi:hypothetical protein
MTPYLDQHFRQKNGYGIPGYFHCRHTACGEPAFGPAGGYGFGLDNHSEPFTVVLGPCSGAKLFWFSVLVNRSMVFRLIMKVMLSNKTIGHTAVTAANTNQSAVASKPNIEDVDR